MHGAVDAAHIRLEDDAASPCGLDLGGSRLESGEIATDNGYVGASLSQYNCRLGTDPF
jgi:hypothetical protein